MSKAQYGLDTALSWIAFFVMLIFTIIILNIPACSGNRDRIEDGIKTDIGGFAGLRASGQLSAYLRTELPDFASLKGRMERVKGTSLSSGIDEDRAIEFLDAHPELYVDKNYGEFIVGLYSHKTSESEVKNAFDAVTTAMFMWQGTSAPTGAVKLFSPTIVADFDGIPDSDFRKYSRPEVTSTDGSLDFAMKSPSATKILPTPDGKEIVVQLYLYSEKERLPST